MRLFKRRSFDTTFQAGAAALIILGMVAAPRLVGARDIPKAFFVGLLIGVAASAVLFGVMKFFDRSRRNR